ncbi:patatin-like protein 3 [Dioscorea cayenensis subsp. rotundata]|uniref:Patatin-like protein 3 n=1 Tax=Dioscorea cayennensis subsp. rotundata TaxID=55577 RepID=A0AB40CJC5_DIOCR|nr:patatin-like protein 3 [Dioscorea cayenensis subsp. rotundata]
MDPVFNVDKLSFEIFSILESKFLFSPCAGAGSGNGKVRILSIDASGDAILAAACLARLEASLRKRSSNPSALLSDFFDLASGSGPGGFLAALLFTPRPDGSPPISTDDALRLLLKTRGRISRSPGILRRPRRIFRRLFGNATLRDAVKPVLIPCYDLRTRAPFMFSRADAVEAAEYDFRVRHVCSATCNAKRVESVDGTTKIEAVGGGVAMGNPAAAAVTHVLNNGEEFPSASGVDDLLLLSFGGGEVVAAPVTTELVPIAGKGHADMVDQALGMAFAYRGSRNYVRIQANGLSGARMNKTKKKSVSRVTDRRKLMEMAEEVLAQKNVESMLFRGKRISDQTNAEKLEWFCEELIKEHERRISSNNTETPPVVLKQAMTPTTTLSATTSRTSSIITTISTSSITSTSSP